MYERKFFIEYVEWESDGKAHCLDSFDYIEYIFQNLTIKDVKEYVKEQRYKKHKPVCSCFLRIWKETDIIKRTISECYEYNDSTFLNNTIFNENNIIIVIPTKEKKCTCGKFEKLILSSNFEKQIEEERKERQRLEEKQRQNMEYYERRIQEENNNHQNRINRLENIINQQQIQNQQI